MRIVHHASRKHNAIYSFVNQLISQLTEARYYPEFVIAKTFSQTSIII